MGRAFGFSGRRKIHAGIWWRNLKEGRPGRPKRI